MLSYLQQKIFFFSAIWVTTLLQMPPVDQILTAEKLTSIAMMAIAVVYLEVQIRRNEKKYNEEIKLRDDKIAKLTQQLLDEKDNAIKEKERLLQQLFISKN
jgi:hypothetical protein